MNKYTINDRKLKKELKKFYANKGNKSKGVGFFASIPHKMAGKRDGRQSIMLNTDSFLVSPYMQRLEKRYEETASDLYLNLMRVSQKIQIEIHSLETEILRLEKDIARKSKYISEASESFDFDRVEKGEENLDASIVRARRNREFNRSIGQHRSALSSMMRRRVEAEDELSTKQATLDELKAHTMVSVRKVKDNIESRMAIYYRSLLKHHPESANLLSVVELELREPEEYYELARTRNIEIA